MWVLIFSKKVSTPIATKVFDSSSENKTVWTFTGEHKGKYIILHADDKFGRPPHSQDGSKVLRAYFNITSSRIIKSSQFIYCSCALWDLFLDESEEKIPIEKLQWFILHLEWWPWKKRKLPNKLCIWIITNKCTIQDMLKEDNSYQELNEQLTKLEESDKEIESQLKLRS